MEDVLGWVAVLIVAITLTFADWPILDPLLSIAFTLFILINVVENLIEEVSLLMHTNPDRALHSNIVQMFLIGVSLALVGFGLARVESRSTSYRL